MREDTGIIMGRNEREEIYARWNLLKTLGKFGFINKPTEEIVRLYKMKQIWDRGYGR